MPKLSTYTCACACALRRGLLVSLLAGLPAAAVQAEPYRLHRQDRLLVRVLLWDFAQGDMSRLSATSGEYTVGEDGQIQVPLAGVVHAEGRNLIELRTALSDLIRRSAGLDRPPEISVELISTLPVYMLGEVQSPGAVTYHPGLTAQQALALAGGLARSATATDAVRIEQLGAETRQWQSNLTRLQAEADMIRAELSALEPGAPATDAPAVPPPADSTLGRLSATETATRAARSDSLQELSALLKTKAANLRIQIALRQSQLSDLQRDLSAVASLKDKGLTNNARLTALSSAVSDMEARKLELETALMLTEQQMNQSARDLAALTEDARSARLSRLATVEADMANAAIRLDSARRQLAALPALTTSAENAPTPHYQLTRSDPTGAAPPQTQTAEPGTALLPGDVLEIILTPPLQEAP